MLLVLLVTDFSFEDGVRLTIVIDVLVNSVILVLALSDNNLETIFSPEILVPISELVTEFCKEDFT